MGGGGVGKKKRTRILSTSPPLMDCGRGREDAVGCEKRD